MGRTLTDATGDRWDVTQDGADDDASKTIQFRHQTGAEYRTESRLNMNELSDRQLLEMLEEETRGETVTEGTETSADPDGYITS